MPVIDTIISQRAWILKAQLNDRDVLQLSRMQPVSWRSGAEVLTDVLFRYRRHILKQVGAR